MKNLKVKNLIETIIAYFVCLIIMWAFPLAVFVVKGYDHPLVNYVRTLIINIL